MDETVQKLTKEIDAKLMEVLLGGPRPKPRMTALRLRGRSFETVDLDDDGKVIEPPPRCCYGTILHATNCKSWGVT